ncbi:hypothetical protein RJ640_027101 [Escallonia rubra]|uniref:CCHC-type domain-containing protein n=1 Tax=Escallonia rubra TaxID=112253 RepID=A0AA88UGX4_9ASTE|nr:hypothetical protein RJ640_027101 [Escallonia rubra]
MSKSRGEQDKSSIECWYCKEIGHIARKCPEKKDKKNRKKHVNNANVAEEDDKSSDGDLYLVSSVEQQEGDVRYIPDLKKNLISLGTLDSIDCSISIKGGVTKVSKCAMMIMKELHEQMTKLADEATCGSTDEQSLEDSDEHPSDSWNLVRDKESRTKKPTQRSGLDPFLTLCRFTQLHPTRTLPDTPTYYTSTLGLLSCQILPSSSNSSRFSWSLSSLLHSDRNLLRSVCSGHCGATPTDSKRNGSRVNLIFEAGGVLCSVRFQLRLGGGIKLSSKSDSSFFLRV